MLRYGENRVRGLMVQWRDKEKGSRYIYRRHQPGYGGLYQVCNVSELICPTPYHQPSTTTHKQQVFLIATTTSSITLWSIQDLGILTWTGRNLSIVYQRWNSLIVQSANVSITRKPFNFHFTVRENIENGAPRWGRESILGAACLQLVTAE